MISRPRLEDLRVIGLYTGRIITGVGLLMLLPLAVSLANLEWNPAVEFLIGIGACLLVGQAAGMACRTDRDLTWATGLVVASFSWFLAMLLGAIPHRLSGHFGSFLDACFDLMSGYTTTGLYLIQDLDHISHGLNTWRHLLSYAGGQGIVVVALTFLIRGTGGAYKMYVGEGKDERLMPNVVRTARVIWVVSLSWLAVGTATLWGIAMSLGQRPGRALLHAVWMFMGTWSTGGFAPQSYNAVYYHSLAFELACVVIFVAGSLNFALHWAVWNGDRGEIVRNIETVSLVATLTAFLLVTAAGLMRLGVYPDTVSTFRKLFYQVVSAHTTTGFSTVYSRTLVRQWGPLAMLGLTLAMAVGASACSTAGGIKGARIGLIFKAFVQTVRRILNPESARVVEKWHHLSTRVLDDATVRSAMLICLAYFVMYGVGTLAGVSYGYPLVDALFDSVSSASNSGLSCGLTSPAMPALLKVVYILQMWAGRLEFLSLFALAGWVLSLARGV